MKALDCCAGAGGLSLGLQRAGFDVLGVEWDADACETHRRNVGPCEHADVWEFEPRARYDLVSAGIPCQSNSIASDDRRGTFETRGQVYAAVLRIACESWAHAVLFENVRGMLSAPSATHANAFLEVRDALHAAGYPHSAHAVLESADYGVPQRRQRVFLVGFASAAALERFAWCSPTHSETLGLLGLKPWVTAREALGVSGDHPALDRPAPCVSATEQRASLAIGSKGSKVNARRCGDVLNPAIGGRLTVAQLAALQSFPADFEFVGNSTAKHHQIGNAVPPPLAEAVGRAVFAALGGAS